MYTKSIVKNLIQHIIDEKKTSFNETIINKKFSQLKIGMSNSSNQIPNYL